MARTLSPEEIATVGELVGIRFPVEDLAAVGEAFAAHCEFVAPLLAAELENVPPALTHDPRWRA